MGSDVLFAQCPTFPNGDMENYSIDSIEYKKDSFTFHLNINSWKSESWSIEVPANKNKPDSCTYSDYPKSGNSALMVPYDKHLELFWANAYRYDTISGIPNSLSGYYHTKKGLDSIDTYLTIIFNDNPGNYLLALDTIDIADYQWVYQKKLKSTNGDYQFFKIEFDDDQFETDSFFYRLLV